MRQIRPLPLIVFAGLLAGPFVAGELAQHKSTDERYTVFIFMLTGVSFLSFVIYWATHFRREFSVVFNLLAYVFNQIVA